MKSLLLFGKGYIAISSSSAELVWSQLCDRFMPRLSHSNFKQIPSYCFQFWGICSLSLWGDFRPFVQVSCLLSLFIPYVNLVLADISRRSMAMNDECLMMFKYTHIYYWLVNGSPRFYQCLDVLPSFPHFVQFSTYPYANHGAGICTPTFAQKSKITQWIV